MSKFCIYCGKELADDQVCDCQGQAAAAQPTPQPQAAPQQASNVVTIDTGAMASTLKSLLTIFNKPSETMKNFVNADNFLVAIILIVAQGLLSAIFTMVSFKDVSDYMEALDASMAGIFFKVLLFSVLLSAIVYGCLFLFVKIFGGDTDAKTMLCVTAVRSAILIPITVLSIILILITPVAGLGAFFFGELFAITYTIVAVKAGSTVSEDKATLLVPIVYLIAAIAFSIILKNVAADYLEAVMSKAMGGIGSMLGGLGSLGGLE